MFVKYFQNHLIEEKFPEVRFFIDEVSATGSAIDGILRKIKEEN
ncbi:hypothetical protein V3317_03160 [Mycoplasmopsis felis]